MRILFLVLFSTLNNYGYTQHNYQGVVAKGTDKVMEKQVIFKVKYQDNYNQGLRSLSAIDIVNENEMIVKDVRYIKTENDVSYYESKFIIERNGIYQKMPVLISAYIVNNALIMKYKLLNENYTYIIKQFIK